MLRTRVATASVLLIVAVGAMVWSSTAFAVVVTALMGSCAGRVAAVDRRYTISVDRRGADRQRHAACGVARVVEHDRGCSAAASCSRCDHLDRDRRIAVAAESDGAAPAAHCRHGARGPACAGGMVCTDAFRVARCARVAFGVVDRVDRRYRRVLRRPRVRTQETGASYQPWQNMGRSCRRDCWRFCCSRS